MFQCIKKGHVQGLFNALSVQHNFITEIILLTEHIVYKMEIGSSSGLPPSRYHSLYVYALVHITNPGANRLFKDTIALPNSQTMLHSKL